MPITFYLNLFWRGVPSVLLNMDSQEFGNTSNITVEENECYTFCQFKWSIYSKKQVSLPLRTHIFLKLIFCITHHAKMDLNKK